jgi:hypothetical protein
MVIEVPIAQHALVQWGTPYRMSAPDTIHDLRLVGDALVWLDTLIQRDHLNLRDVVWASAVEDAGHDDLRRIFLHAIARGRYSILAFQLHPTEMSVLRRIVRSLQSASQPDLIMPSPPMPAFVANQNVYGQITAGAPVHLYLLPHRLIVLHHERVTAQINLGRLRRVLAIERLPAGIASGLADWRHWVRWLGVRQVTGGLLRLHSAGETALFITPRYADLAQSIAQTATCTAEFIAREDKEGKRR